MNRRLLSIMAVAGLALATVSCFSITEDAEVAVNIVGVGGTFDVSAGVTTFPSTCNTIDAGEYLDVDFAELRNARIYDIQVQTIGAFAGTLSGGSVTVNGQPMLSFAGAWNTFNSPQSVLDSDLVTLHSGAVTTLVNAINNQDVVTVCVSCATSQPFTSGLRVKVEISGQVDAQL